MEPSAGDSNRTGPVARAAQYEALLSCLKLKDVLPPSLFLWGPTGSGKSFVVQRVLEDAGIKQVAFISAREIVCGLKPFLITIVRQLFEIDGNPGDWLSSLKCESIADFVREIQRIAAEEIIAGEPLVLVLEETETLRVDHSSVLEILSRLKDLAVSCNLCVIFLSSLPMNSYSCLMDMRPTVSVEFPQYTKDELIQILISETPKAFHPTYYQFLVKMMLNVFYFACRDVRKLQRLAILNYEEFIKPINGETEKKLSQSKLNELWKAIQPKLTQDFKTLKANIVPAQSKTQPRLLERKLRNFYRFPEMTKYLLISAYLATANPTSSDKRFFVKSQLGKKRRKVQELQEPETSNEQQVFSQIRLFAIYSFLTENMVSKNPLLLSQIQNLCDLELLERIDSTTNAPLDDPKYRCLASYDLIEDIAKSVDLDLKRFLYSHV